ncbi:MAG: HEAT repeat domain-containing protein [Pirellulales bacterium]
MALIRLETLRVVARCGSPVAGETLREALNDSDRDVRVAACQAWGIHGGAQAVPQLSEALRKDPSVDVRLAAGKALGQIGGQESVQALSVALDDQDPALQYRAIQSLREVTGKDFGDNVAAWRDYTRGSGAPAEISLVDRMKLKAF